MSEVTVGYIDGLLKDLANPEEAAAYLNAAMEDGDQQVLLLARRDVTEARILVESRASYQSEGD